jgi:hypothetical protein
MRGVILRTPFSSTLAASLGSVFVMTQPLMPSSSGSQFRALQAGGQSKQVRSAVQLQCQKVVVDWLLLLLLLHQR